MVIDPERTLVVGLVDAQQLAHDARAIQANTEGDDLLRVEHTMHRPPRTRACRWRLGRVTPPRAVSARRRRCTRRQRCCGGVAHPAACRTRFLPRVGANPPSMATFLATPLDNSIALWRRKGRRAYALLRPGGRREPPDLVDSGRRRRSGSRRRSEGRGATFPPSCSQLPLDAARPARLHRAPPAGVVRGTPRRRR